MERISKRARETAKHFDELPDSGVVETAVTALVSSLSQRTVRYHPRLRQIRISKNRVGQNVGEIRALLANEDPRTDPAPAAPPAPFLDGDAA